MSDLTIPFNVNFSMPAVDLLKRGMTSGNIFDIVHENLIITDHYAEQIKEDAMYIRDTRVTEDIIKELEDTPIVDLEQFIEAHPDKIFCDTDTHEREDYPNDEIVFGVPCELDLGAFINLCEHEKKIENNQKKEMSLDRAKELLGFFVDHECVGENTNTAIQKLFSVGMTEEEIQNFGFSAKDIEYAKESEEEFEI